MKNIDYKNGEQKMNIEEKDSFFKTIKKSITDFEKYPELASKKIGTAISYLIKLLAIFTLIISSIYIFEISKNIKETLKYIDEQIPEFIIKDNELEIQTDKPIIIEKEGSLFNIIIIDSKKELEEETLINYKNKINGTQNGILILKDKFFIKIENAKEIISYNYSELFENYQISNFDKQQLIEIFTGKNLVAIYVSCFIIIYIYTFLVYITSIWLDILLLACFGYISSIFIKIRIKFIAICKIAIHSLTLPILLNLIVIIVETFTSFRIKYFEIMYMGIACVYIISAIMMIKADIIKHQEELTKIIEEQAKVKEELEKQEQEKKEEQEKKDKEDKEKKQDPSSKEKNNKQEGNEPQGENT